MKFKLAIAAFALVTSGKVYSMEQNPLRYWFWWPIRTYDTFEADTPPVMQLARNIYATLISDYIDGTPQGLLAKDWYVSSDGKDWRFTLRTDLKFEDGSDITPEVVLLNFKRILWLTRDEGLVLNSLLPEVKTWKSMHELSKTITLENKNELVFHFNKRPVGLFEALGQPIYGIAHPKCFDSNGKWVDSLKTISSGQYKISSRGVNYIRLESRHVYKEVAGSPSFAAIYWPIDKGDTVVKAIEDGRADLTVEHSFALGKATLDRLTKAGVEAVKEPSVRMHFLHLNHTRGPFKSKVLRSHVRDLFLKNLSKNKNFLESGISVDASFIPKGGVGYKQISISHSSDTMVNKGTGELNKMPVEILLYPFSADKQIQEAVESSLISTLNELKIVFKITRYEERFEAFNRMRKGDFDIIIRGTGILVHNPYGDLRMMFMSTVGARIPDPTGKIPALIEQAESEPSSEKRAEIVTRINESVFDEASIITFAHSGLLYLKRGNIDFKHYNLFADPIEFRAISWPPRETP